MVSSSAGQSRWLNLNMVIEKRSAFFVVLCREESYAKSGLLGLCYIIFQSEMEDNLTNHCKRRGGGYIIIELNFIYKIECHQRRISISPWNSEGSFRWSFPSPATSATSELKPLAITLLSITEVQSYYIATAAAPNAILEGGKDGERESVDESTEMQSHIVAVRSKLVKCAHQPAPDAAATITLRSRLAAAALMNKGTTFDPAQ